MLIRHDSLSNNDRATACYESALDVQSHTVPKGRGILFGIHVAAKDGFEHRVALLILASEEFWYGIDLNADVNSV